MKSIMFKRIKTFLFTLSFVGSTYVISGSLNGYSVTNNTIENDIYSLLCMDDIPNNKYTKSLKIDMDNIDNISFINEYKYLDSIEINNAQYLSIEDINILNSSNISTYYLFFDKNYVINNISNKYDFSNFNINSNYILQFNDIEGNDEVDSVILCNYITNYELYNTNISYYKYLDDNINNLMSNIELSNYNGNFYDFIKFMDIVSDYLEYDPQVEESTISDYKKIHNYNKYSLSTVLFDNNKALCTNYADLLTILSIKNDISVKTMKGYYQGEGHSWNMVNIDGKDYYIDLTKVDLNSNLSNIIKTYLLDPNEVNYNNIINSILIDINDSNYSLDKNIKVSKYNFFGSKNDQYPSILIYMIVGYLVAYVMTNLVYYEDNNKKKLVLK